MASSVGNSIRAFSATRTALPIFTCIQFPYRCPILRPVCATSKHSRYAAKTLSASPYQTIILPPPSVPSFPLPHHNPHLLLQQSTQSTPIPQIHPLPLLPLLQPSLRRFPSSRFTRYPIIALRTGYRRRKPDLFVRWLFVQDVGAVGGEGES